MDTLSRLARSLEDTLDNIKCVLLKQSNEQEQALIRLVFAALVIVYSFSNTGPTTYELPWANITLSQALSSSYGVAITLLLIVNFFIPSFSKTFWRFLALSLDVIFLSGSMALVPELAMPLFFIYLWVIFGFGFPLTLHSGNVKFKPFVANSVPLILSIFGGI